MSRHRSASIPPRFRRPAAPFRAYEGGFSHFWTYEPAPSFWCDSTVILQDQTVIFGSGSRVYDNTVILDRVSRVYDETLILLDHGAMSLADSRVHVESMSQETSGTFKESILKTMMCDDGDEDDICVICQDNLTANSGRLNVRLHCGHRYHPRCISQWITQRNTCPLCKATALPLD